jgi:hypothetical protein
MNRDFVDNVATGNNLKAETDFSSELSSKIGVALETKRKEIAKTFVSSMSAKTTSNETN